MGAVPVRVVYAERRGEVQRVCVPRVRQGAVQLLHHEAPHGTARQGPDCLPLLLLQEGLQVEARPDASLPFGTLRPPAPRLSAAGRRGTGTGTRNASPTGLFTTSQKVSRGRRRNCGGVAVGDVANARSAAGRSLA